MRTLTKQVHWLTLLPMVAGFALALLACGGMGASTPAAAVTVQPSQPAATASASPTPTPTSTTTPSSTPTVTPSPTATLTPEPTDTPAPPPTNTEMPAPTATETLLPTSELASWKGIPIMPQANPGEEKSLGYIYTVPATVQQVQDFYNVEMPRLGWQLSMSGPTTLVPGSMQLIYQKDGENIAIGIYPEEHATRVMLLRPVIVQPA